MEGPRLIRGGLDVDERGEVGFVNEAELFGVRRFYTIRNHRVGVPRAWHGHREEAKWITVVAGAALVCAVSLRNLELESEKESEVPMEPHARIILSAKVPAVLYVPPGYANGCMALEPGTVILHLSDKSLEESCEDDVRFSSDLFADLWKVKSW